MFGKVSERWGRRPCLLVTVAGTLMPVCSLAFWGSSSISTRSGQQIYNYNVVQDNGGLEELDGIVMEDGEISLSEGSYYPDATSSSFDSNHHDDYHHHHESSFLSLSFFPLHRLDVFVLLLALSGIFSSTFTVKFAYISDIVHDRDGRVAAYGLALATFGLSFTIGPLLGGYLANVDELGKGHGGRDDIIDRRIITIPPPKNYDDDEIGGISTLGQHRVFVTSLILTLMDLFYIHFILPESLHISREENKLQQQQSHVPEEYDCDDDDNGDGEMSSTTVAATATMSNLPLSGASGMGGTISSCQVASSSKRWSPFDSIRYLGTDPILATLGRITFLYYTALHAVVSTLVLYATRRFHLGPQRLGELMAALGLSTMISEAVLVRIAIPLFGEVRCMRIGLASFSLQCVLLAVADSPWHLFGCAFLAMAGNLVYPSVSSLVSSTVRPDMVGRALGAINGVKSVTEGIGPLLFGSLLTMSENDRLPGWPYFGAAIMVAVAYQVCRELPMEDGVSFNNNNKSSRYNDSVDEEYICLMENPRRSIDDDDDR
jgi:MFS family permease